MPAKLDDLVHLIQAYDGPPVRLMEVCGTHTRAISRFGIPALFPERLSLISGPGCPVCVTPSAYIDRAAELAAQPGRTVLSFGDMLRVPGNRMSLGKAKALGGGVSLMISPFDALRLAVREPDRQFIVTAVGFETTLPSYALLVRQLAERGIQNVKLLTSLKALIPALDWLCRHNPDVQGFIGPGHVSAIIGADAYEPVCARYRLPLTVAGFTYEHLVAAIADLIRQISRGEHRARNLYPSAVTREGNAEAQALIEEVFEKRPAVWRGLGRIEDSGYRLRAEYEAFDAGDFDDADVPEPAGCLCGSVLAGRARPVDCALFGARCSPENPVGPCMVSSEGACGILHASARER